MNLPRHAESALELFQWARSGLGVHSWKSGKQGLPAYGAAKLRNRAGSGPHAPADNMAGDDVVKKRPVPKFASFKPQPETPRHPAATKESASNRDDRHRQPSSQPSSQAKSRGHHNRDDRQRATSSDRREPLFVVDKRGDPLIVKYGSNDRYKVPAYRRAGAGRVLGAQGRVKLIYDGPKQIFTLGDQTREGPSAFRDRRLLSQASRKKEKVFRLRSGAQHGSQPLVDKNLDYLPLSEGHKPEGRDPGGGKDSMQDEGPDYRSIQGKAKARDFVDSDLESAGTSDVESEDGIRLSNPARQRSAQLTRHLKEHPSDADSWLQLVDLQAALVGVDETAQLTRSSNETTGLANVRVSLLEEAIASTRDASGREQLLLRLMREGSQAWSNKELAKRWADIKFEGSSFLLWKAHLNHELCQMTTFTYDGLKNIHLDRMRSLSERLSDAAKMLSHEDQTNPLDDIVAICDEIIYVFTRLTCFVRDCGYSELAVAAWQAALEVAFAHPDCGGRPEPDVLKKSLQSFWESEAPRIGEAEAQGWRNFNSEDMPDAPEAARKPNLTLPDTRDVYKAWAAVEKQKSESATLPARTLDEAVEDDPFRIVMFSDLEPFLLFWPPILLQRTDLRASILNAFLLFCRLPTASTNLRRIPCEMSEDPFILRCKTGLDEASVKHESYTEDGLKRPPRFLDPGHRLCPSNDVLFPGQDWFNFFEYDASHEHELAATTMTQLATTFGFECIAEYSLGLACNRKPTNVRKAAKALIKKWPNNTTLYSAYAMAEWRSGNRDVASNVLLSATSQELPGKELLWMTWAWLDLEAGDMKSALGRCVATSGTSIPQTGNQASATYSQLLKARQMLSSSRGFLLSVGNLDQAILFAQASCLLEYLSDCIDSAESAPSRQGRIDAAMEVIHTFTSEAVDRGHAAAAALERLLQHAAHLLYLHVVRGPFRPTYLRDQLRRFILLFPPNTVFLRLFAWADSSILLNDPVRDLLRDPVLSAAHDCVTSRIFALHHEARAGTVHSIAVAFERALVGSNNDACRGNVGLWLDYVRFCCRHLSSTARTNSQQNNKAKDVYYRAIGSCPWSKELAMEAFAPAMVKSVDSAELRSIFHTIARKGLRVHVDLEDYVANWSKTRKRKERH